MYTFKNTVKTFTFYVKLFYKFLFLKVLIELLIRTLPKIQDKTVKKKIKNYVRQKHYKNRLSIILFDIFEANKQTKTWKTNK